MLPLGAHEVIERGEPPEPQSFDVLAGPSFPGALEAINRGGRFVSSGAIGGPIVELDMRTFYLHDIQLIGCTTRDEPVFSNLVGCIEGGEIPPVVAKTFPLADIIVANRSSSRRNTSASLF